MAYGYIYEHGGIVDDLMVYFRSDEDIMLWLMLAQGQRL